MTYRLTERAEADVEAIADFIVDDRVDAAMRPANLVVANHLAARSRRQVP